MKRPPPRDFAYKPHLIGSGQPRLRHLPGFADHTTLHRRGPLDRFPGTDSSIERPSGDVDSSHRGQCTAGTASERPHGFGQPVARISHRGGWRPPSIHVASIGYRHFWRFPCNTQCNGRQPITALTRFRSLSLDLRSTRSPGYEFPSGRRESGCKHVRFRDPR